MRVITLLLLLLFCCGCTTPASYAKKTDIVRVYMVGSSFKIVQEGEKKELKFTTIYEARVFADVAKGDSMYHLETYDPKRDVQPRHEIHVHDPKEILGGESGGKGSVPIRVIE